MTGALVAWFLLLTAAALHPVAQQPPGPSQSPRILQPPQVAHGLRERFDFGKRSARFDLPGRLREVSGLALAPDGRLFAHGDERGRVFIVDPATGAVDRGFHVGAPEARDDFEGIAIVGERFFLVSSRGLLYEFREVPVGAATAVRVTDSGLGDRCEIEGLTYHAASDALLLACKTLAPPSAEVRVHRMPIAPDAAPLPPIRVPWSALESLGLGEGFHPSAIDVDPTTGTLVLAAAREEALLEIDLEGRVLSAVLLSRRRHPQTEGLAFGLDGTLYLADEANGRDARVTTYRPARAGTR